MKLLHALVLLITAATTANAFELPQSHVRGANLAQESYPENLHGRRTLSEKEYTLDVDFAEGTLVNVNYIDTPNQLQLDSESQPFDFIWVAASGRGTVVKIDTNSGDILGEYRSTPSSQGPGDPSRTTVDSDGSVWLTNRSNIYGGYGSIVHIGLEENNQCEDRNGNGIIDTSTGLGDIRTWNDPSGVRGVATADDECIVHYTKVNSQGTRHVSITPENDVWVGGYTTRTFDLVKGGKYDVVDSGTILRSEAAVGYGGYGGLMDPNRVIWSARNLLRWDTDNTLTGPNGDPSGDSIGPPAEGSNWSGQSGESYGLCIDSQGNVWNTQLDGNTIRKYSPDGTFLGAFGHGNRYAQGCVVGLNDDVYVAHSLFNAIDVGHIKNDGTFVGNISLEGGVGPTGVAVDKNGKIWAANIISNTVSRIDPTLGGIGADSVTPIGKVDLTVDLESGASPYNYSDMTGSTVIQPPSSGTWTIVYNGEWRRLEWNAVVPEGASLSVRARSSTDGSSWTPWEEATSGEDLGLADGEYLQIQVSFVRAPSGESPILYDLMVSNDECEPLPLLEPYPDVSYTVGNLELDYSTNEVGDTDVFMTFGYSPSSEDTPEPDFQAVIYAFEVDDSLPKGGRCLTDTVLAVTSANAHLVDGVADPLVPHPFNLEIDTTSATAPVLNIDTPFAFFGDPDYYLYYSQNAQCSDEVGGPYDDWENPNQPPDQCGRFDVCVEFQVLICEEKVDFVDVHLQLEFYLTGRCDGCLDAILQRDDPIDEGADVNVYDMVCYHCDRENEFTPVEVGQDDPIKACLNLETPVPRACIHSIVDLDFEVKIGDDTTTYDVYPGAVEGENSVFLTGSGASCGVGNLAGADGDGSYNGCSVEFGVPAVELQKLTLCDGYDGEGQCICPPDEICASQGTFVGTVLMGYGTNCDDDRRLRHLQDDLVLVEFTGQPFLIIKLPPKCSSNWILGFLQFILGWLFSLLGQEAFCEW